MVKHITARFAWHDNKWNGAICKDPKSNIYCIDNYSLLSKRIQRRKNVKIESKNCCRSVKDVLSSAKYLPPCYWCINANGGDSCKISDKHPFKEFESTTSVNDVLDHASIFTWCFKLGFDKDSVYVPPKVLQDSTKRYIERIKQGRSIVFFYLNYGNPINSGENSRLDNYILVGASLADGTGGIEEYNISDDVLAKKRNSDDSMRNLSKQAWQFRINLDDTQTVLLPYHEYLQWASSGTDLEKNDRLKKLDDVAIPVIDGTLVPHFRYVSMHISHDKAIFLLYQMLLSIKNMRSHNLISEEALDTLESKTKVLLKIAWQERGKYPGFKNYITAMLGDDISLEQDDLETIFDNSQKSIQKFLDEGDKGVFSLFDRIQDKNVCDRVKRFVSNCDVEKLRFYSTFDFSIENFRNITHEFNEPLIRSNPYLLFERYHRDFEKEFKLSADWDINENDYGIGLYQLDIALIPDLNFADWGREFDFEAKSPERLRAVVVDILRNSTKDGNSCLGIQAILESISNYPLYYISSKLELSEQKILEYQNNPKFSESFFISVNNIYQLKELRFAEEIIENFINTMLKKNISSNDTESIENVRIRAYDLVQQDLKTLKSMKKFEKEQFEKEREILYFNSLSKGLFILSGKAGSGKTTATSKLILDHYKNNKCVFVFSLSGKSNIVLHETTKTVMNAGGFNLANAETQGLIKISTIHKFLFSEIQDNLNRSNRPLVNRARSLLNHILEYSRWDLIYEYAKFIKDNKLRFNPKVLILDESSMIDELLLAVLFSSINVDNLEHLIFVGDENQLPPIGIGRPFVDAIYYLRNSGFDSNMIHLESNLRFPPSSSLGEVSRLFESDQSPLPGEIEKAFHSDDTMKVEYFSDESELKKIIRNVLGSPSIKNKNSSLFDLFTSVFESKPNFGPQLERVQIICPKRTGSYGIDYINFDLVCDSEKEFQPGSKLICEQNIYVWSDYKKASYLAAANGSIGYIKPTGSLYFEAIESLKEVGGVPYAKAYSDISYDLRNVTSSKDPKVNLGYALTVHKSQGSGFDDVIFVFSELTPFISKELVYTALTRPKNKLYFAVHSKLKDELWPVLTKVYNNSSIAGINTLLFSIKRNIYLRPYVLTLKNGSEISVASKVEKLIGKCLDDLGIEFIYETEELIPLYHMKPDFKFTINGHVYYLEHLGFREANYGVRWATKLNNFKKAGLVDNLITTTENPSSSNVESGISKIIQDIKSNRLKNTPGSYSKHHYVL